MTSRILGLDLAPSHSGWCLMIGGKVAEVGYTTEHKRLNSPPKSAVISFGSVPIGCYPIPTPLTSSTPTPTEQRTTKRIYAQEKYLRSVVGRIKPDLVVIEDFAFGAALSTSGSYDAGGIGYAIRVMLYDLCVPVRVIDPMSLKLLATGKGNAQKIDMMEAAIEQRLLPAGVSDLVHVSANGNVVCAYPAEDIADAAWLAHMGHIESQVRAGVIGLEQLNEGTRRVFLRTTKRQPTNLLDRPYIPGRMVAV